MAQVNGIGASLRWSDLYLATGGALDWNNGTYRLTQSSTTLSSSGNFSLPSGYLRRGTPVTKTADITVGVSDNWIINNKAGSTATWTLPAVSQIGREIMIQNYQAQTVVSASSNVVPLGGGAAGTAILSANVGRWCTLVSDGTNWVIMAGVI